MWLFDSSLFWFVQGLLACLALVGFKLWTEDRHIRMQWWKWILVLVWMAFVGASVAFVGTSLGENEPRAAILGGLFAGMIALIGAVAWK